MLHMTFYLVFESTAFPEILFINYTRNRQLLFLSILILVLNHCMICVWDSCIFQSRARYTKKDLMHFFNRLEKVSTIKRPERNCSLNKFFERRLFFFFSLNGQFMFSRCTFATVTLIFLFYKIGRKWTSKIVNKQKFKPIWPFVSAYVNNPFSWLWFVARGEKQQMKKCKTCKI